MVKIEMSLLENGADSFKEASDKIEKISSFGSVLTQDIVSIMPHNMKDAVLSLNQGIELLFKLILKNTKEYLVFADISKYMAAKEKMKPEKPELKNVLDVNPNLKTISLYEAIRRIKYLCDYDLPSELEITVEYLNKIRNQFMHYEISLNYEEIQDLLEKLKIGYKLSYDFFELHINGFASELENARYNITDEELDRQIKEMERIIDKFL